MSFMFHPRIIDTFKEGYSFEFFRKDIFSGLTVAIVAIPLSIAFAIASGATPIVGIFTAIIGGLITSTFGGSKYNISGPAGAFVGIISGIIAHYGYTKMLISTFIAGMILMMIGTFKLGRFVKYIPNCVVIGFSLGLGLDILSGQLFDFFGLSVHGGENFFSKITLCYNHIQEINMNSVILGVSSVVIILLVRKINSSLPAFLIAIIINTLFAYVLNLNAETINSKFGIMHLDLPYFRENVLDEVEHPLHLYQYLGISASIAVLAGVEALLAATIADKMTNSYHRPNTELFSLGVANCTSALFGGLPIAGTTARTIVNVKSGAKSPFAGIFHALFLIVLMVIFAKLISCVNMATIAGILFVVSVDMMSIKKIVNLLKSGRRLDNVMIFFTALCVLYLGIVVAIFVGSFLYMFLNKKVKLD